ncbi:MAG: helix-turn-helix domain-containing protein, partial [Alphaproteobacteria bacterium]
FSVAEVAALAGVSRVTAYAWIARGYLGTLDFPGAVRVKRSELERVLGRNLTLGGTMTVLQAAKARRAAKRRKVRPNEPERRGCAR